MKRIIPQYIAKIEGHGIVKIDFKEHTAQLQVLEGERLFEGILIGRNYIDAPFVTSRICGVCPTAHNIASIKAIEDVFGVSPSEKTVNLRKLMLCGQMIQSHVLHLFFLALPDYVGLDSALFLTKKDPAKFRLALNLKNLGDEIISGIGGRAIHPLTTTVGGFSKLPSLSDIRKLRNNLESCVADAKETINLFGNFNYPELERKTEYMSLHSDGEYPLYNGLIGSDNGSKFNPKDYKKEITETVRNGSTAKYGERSNHGFMVGALSRVNMHRDELNPLAKKALKDSEIKFPSYNPFHNNFAQAIEILHFIEEGIKLIGAILDGEMEKEEIHYVAEPEGLRHVSEAKPLPHKVREGRGIGVIEAPRGNLYHDYEIGKDGKIKDCNIITPTVQNLTNIEEDIRELMKITNDRKEIRKLVEMLIRAYDPCITCSVH